MGGKTPYNGLHGEAPPERGIFFGLWVYERLGIFLVEVYERVGKSVIRVSLYLNDSAFTAVKRIAKF